MKSKSEKEFYLLCSEIIAKIAKINSKTPHDEENNMWWCFMMEVAKIVRRSKDAMDL